MGTVTLKDVKAANDGWFSPRNRKFFGDVSYRILHGKQTGKPYLVRATYAWSDMFGREKELHWRLNPLEKNLEIRPLIDVVFPDYKSVKTWLRTEGQNGTENSND